MLSAFVEMWHPETSPFHLSFGEITVTLDDIDTLFHNPITGRFFKPPHINHVTTLCMVVDDLEVSEAMVLAEFGVNKGYHLWMSWLRERYKEHVEA